VVEYFANDIVLCSPSRNKLKKLLKKVNNWVIHNEMTFGIKNVLQWLLDLRTPLFSNKKDLTFYLAGQPLPITDCYIYLGIPFDKSLELELIVKYMNNKVNNAF
jgi:hypothetical protein